jgi:transcription antitermination factor NusG
MVAPVATLPVSRDRGALPEARAGEWHVLLTRARQEKILARDLCAMGIGHYLPLIWQARFYGNRKVKVQVPLFAGYMFLRGSLDDVYAADRTKRVARTIEVADQDRLDWELRNISIALSENATLDPYPYLQEGVCVEVRAGPFRGLQGWVDSRLPQDRIILQVGMIGTAVSLELDASLLMPVR